MKVFSRDFVARRDNVSRGKLAEQEAASWLVGQGYRVVARNARTPVGEIDLIGWEGATLCFVEVKARGSQEHGSGLEAVGPAKQRRLALAASWYLSRFRETPPCRFDVLALDHEAGEWRFRLVRDAFQME